jgi:hypothetical protein
MKITAAICIALVVSSVSTSYADYGVSESGTWPKSWPAELEPLRKQARTFEGPLLPLLHFAIPFTKREEFESAWPQLLKVKSKGAPIVLKRAPSFWLQDKAAAGVCVHTPPEGEAPLTDGKVANGNWEKTIYIELIVDGDVVDLNRIQIPAETPIIDERFSKIVSEKPEQQSAKVEDRLTRVEERLKTLQKEIASLGEQRLNDRLLLQLSGTWHQLNPKNGQKESDPPVTPKVWRLTAFGNSDRHELGDEVSVVVLGELAVDASTKPARITFSRKGQDGKSNLAAGIVRFRARLCEIAMSRKLIPAGGDLNPVFPAEFQATNDFDLVLLAPADGVPFIE